MEKLLPKEEYNFLAGLIIDSAVQAQTKTISDTTIPRRPPTPWWDQDCSNLNAQKSTACKHFRKTATFANFKNYGEIENQLRNLLQTKKRGYWCQFVHGLTRGTAMTTLWSTERRLRNSNVSNENVKYPNQ